MDKKNISGFPKKENYLKKNKKPNNSNKKTKKITVNVIYFQEIYVVSSFNVERLFDSK